MSTYTPMILQYLSIKAGYRDAFLFFRLGDFYEMFFDDAEKASKLLEITLTSRDGGVEEKIPMCGVPYHSAEAYISKLIDMGYKVAICEQVEDPKVAKGVVRREVVRVITPGTVMEGKLIEGKSSNYIAAVVATEEGYGISVSDISTGEFYATIIKGEIDRVVGELNQFNPSELIIEASFYEKFQPYLHLVKATISQIEILLKDNIDEFFSNHFPDMDMKELSYPIKIGSFTLLDYLESTQNKRLDYFNKINVYDAKEFMILDQFSKRNLELTQTSREQTKKGSLVWLLDQTETAMGSRLLRRWLEKPLLSFNMIQERLDTVESLYHDPILLEDLKSKLKYVYDIERLISRISFGNATPKDLYHLRNSLEQVPSMLKLIMESESSGLKSMFEAIDICHDVATFIKQAIQEDPPISPKSSGLIRRGFDEKLDMYYLASTEGKEWLKNLEKREKEATGIKSLKIGFNKVFGYYIEVTRSNLAQVPLDRYIRKQTLANAERYITEELKDREEQILEAEEKMQELEYEIFTKVREEVSIHQRRLQELAQKIAKLDVLMSFSVVCMKNRYHRPRINQDGRIMIKQGRHPVIEAVNKDYLFIPNDIYLNQEDQQILLITGPNMSGKSTYMRQIALTTIMAQIGCFVPADDADVTVVDQIFTRIGAGDDLTSGQSTFMVEMVETNNAIKYATASSLILLDEIGRGTSTYDGMALAQAIIQYIHEHVKAKTLFSTHYHELTVLGDRYPRIHNIHVNVIEKNGEVIFLHKIEKGKADKSYGIHVAELAGMPKEIIENAKHILKDLETNGHQGLNSSVQLDFFQQAVQESVSKKGKRNDEFHVYKQIVKEIEELDLLNISPMEGFQLLYDIQKKLRK